MATKSLPLTTTSKLVNPHTGALPAWVATQQKAFMRWANTYLETQDIPPLENLAPDLSNGVRLIQLLEIIGGESLGRYYRNPKLLVQKAENVNTALDFIKHRGVIVYNIGAEDIIDANLKLVLGLLWVLILRFTISDINEEGLSAKEGLLLWCQRKTAGYEGVDIRDFSTSWSDGLAFCALLDRHRPDLMDFYELDPSDHRGNTAAAFEIASEQIGIPQLLDAEDICDVAKPDERSVMTYVAYWFHAFSALDKIETAGRRLEKFVDVTASAIEMQHAFEDRMRALLEAIQAKQDHWRTSQFTGTYADAKTQRTHFGSYKRTTKRQWITEKSELTSLLGNIRTKLATYGLQEYEPPKGLRIVDLEAAWRSLIHGEAQWARRINNQLREIKERLRKEFADTANDFALSLDTVSLRISELDGELERQLVGITDLSDQLKPLDGLLAELKHLDEKCIEANVEENDHTVYAYDELEYELGLAKQSVVKKLAFIENQIVARSMTNLTPIQLEEFESVFRFFDKGQANCLVESEFSGALASLGLVYSEEEMHDVFQIASGRASSLADDERTESSFNEKINNNKQFKGNDTRIETNISSSALASPFAEDSNHSSDHSSIKDASSRSSISSSPRKSSTATAHSRNLSLASTTQATDEPTVSFEQFIKFMVEVTEDQQTSEQVFQSFVDIANGKKYVTELDLQNSLLDDAMIDKLVASMPADLEHEGGYDYVDYMRKLTGIKLDVPRPVTEEILE